nr:6K1 [Hyacinth mosaic virus]
AKKECEVELERVIAFMALVMMVFDNERSDYVHRALSKVKSLMSSIDSDVKHQALDDIKDEFSERNLHVDFELDGDVVPGNMSIDHT